MDEQDQLNPAFEKEEKVVLGDQEIKNIRDFFTRFKLEMSPEHDAVLTAFTEPGGKTIRNQKLIKMFLAEIMVNAHEGPLAPIPIFKDPAFDELKKVCTREYYNLKFDFEVEGSLSPDKEVENKG